MCFINTSIWKDYATLYVTGTKYCFGKLNESIYGFMPIPPRSGGTTPFHFEMMRHLSKLCVLLFST